MSQPILGTNNALVTDVQGQSQASAYVVVYEIQLPDSNIGGTGIDKLFFHDGRNGTSDITWYSLDNESDFGSSSSSKYSVATYTALPIESEGWEVRGSGTGSLPRPTVRMGNINQYFKTYLADWDDLVGAKVIRRKTLQKYLIGGSAAANPPVEFNRDVFYIERKATETPIMVEFELVSAFDVEGVQLPRRSIIAARCPWKYKDTTQGGCDWSEDSRLAGVADPLYYDKDDNIIAKDAVSPGTNEYTFWGRHDLVKAGSETYLYEHNVSYAVGAYVEYQRPIGSLYPITTMIENTTNRVTITVPALTAAEFAVGDWLVIKGATDARWNHKNVPLYVDSKGGSGATSTIIVRTNSSADGTLSTAGYIQGCRNTLYKCTRAHTIMSGDDADELVKPTNISYWEFGDICGKRLSSCSKRFAYVANSGKVDIVHVKMVNGVLQGGAGYTGQPTITFTNHAEETSPAGSGAVATATIVGGVITKFAVSDGGSNYSHNPTIAISGGGASTNAQAEARVKHQSTDNVALPFGGFPGASFG